MSNYIILQGIYFDGSRFTATDPVPVDTDKEAEFFENCAAEHNMSPSSLIVVDCSTSKNFANNRVNGLNFLLANKELHVFKCKDCNRFWLIEDRTIEWYHKKGLVPPKRCFDCREKRKQYVTNDNRK